MFPKIDLETYKRIAARSQMTTQNLTAAYRVLVLRHVITAVSERMDMPQSRVRRACENIVDHLAAPDSRYACGAEAFDLWFAERVALAEPVRDEHGRLDVPSVAAWELREDLKRFAPDVHFGPAQFGECLKRKGVKRVVDGETRYLGIALQGAALPERAKLQPDVAPAPSVKTGAFGFAPSGSSK